MSEVDENNGRRTKLSLAVLVSPFDVVVVMDDGTVVAVDPSPECCGGLKERLRVCRSAPAFLALDPLSLPPLPLPVLPALGGDVDRDRGRCVGRN